MFTWIKNKWMQWVMKDALIESLRQDLVAALTINLELHDINKILCVEVIKLRKEAKPWYQAQDEDMARQEAQERADEVQINYDQASTEEAELNELIDDDYQF